MKYFIIPQNDITMEIYAETPEQALEDFAWDMDSDMNAYFKAVTEEEYELIQKEKQYVAYREQELEFRIEDAKNHVEDLYEGRVTLTEEEYIDIAKEFIERYDCNCDENSLFEWIIEGYVDKEEE